MLRHTLIPSCCAAALLAACSNGGMTEPSTIAPTVATVAAPTSTTAGPTTAPTTTVVDTTSSTVAPAVLLSPDGPWTRVDSAPGVDTPGLFYELMPKLWVYLPTKEDLDHGITWTFTEPDRPVIEAYLRARLVYFESITSKPMDLDHPGWSEMYADGGEMFLSSLRSRTDEGQVASLADGIVLRPSVLGEDRSDTTAIVFDCVLDGGYFVLPDGSLAPGSVRGVIASGVGYRLELIGSDWLVSDWGVQEDACL